ncbi:hypothetical protein [Erwinia piriflorinigrans]|uniref:Uncharacterized protein n=1 Tax=Erwinia piriflorinigrans CFBP 5888 TaxID=1161919 RepID=V5Z4X3_9GAMM|nr:hypothetical protein [Erwinia piriflorinigrans]CCG85998.1 hypothetical protein EPIR_0633 [Erwinia piriflorinigrans CFBP 5888]
MKLTLFSGRTGRIVIVLLLVLLMTVAMFAVASLFMAYDPDGHLTRSWLHQSRWGLFGWRITLYVGLALVWLLKVRPQAVRYWPQIRQRLPRTELLAVLFMLATEYVAWTSATQGG